MTTYTSDDLKPGTTILTTLRSNTISGAPFLVAVKIVWVENGHVHYRAGSNPKVEQTPITRMLEILNDSPGR